MVQNRQVFTIMIVVIIVFVIFMLYFFSKNNKAVFCIII